MLPVHRVILVCTALAGLFVMHGVAVGPGCPGGTRAAGPATAVHGPATGHDVSRALRMPASVSTIGHRASVPPSTASVSPSPASVVIDDAGNAGGHGALCVSLPPRTGSAGLLAFLLMLGIGALGWTWPAWGRGAGADDGGHRRRAPPPAGSHLLIRLCVSRT